MYVERYSKDKSTYEQDTAEGLKGLIEVALEFTKLPQFLGRSEPTVITVSSFSLYLLFTRGIYDGPD